MGFSYHGWLCRSVSKKVCASWQFTFSYQRISVMYAKLEKNFVFALQNYVIETGSTTNMN
jgi:hypothetical protein